MAALADLGAEIVPVEIDLVADEPQFRVILETLLAARIGARVRAEPQSFDPTFIRTVENGSARSGPETQAAAAARSAVFRRIEALLDRIDQLATPTLGEAALEEGREASPSAAILDSQTVGTADQKGDSKASTPERRSTGASATS